MTDVPPGDRPGGPRVTVRPATAGEVHALVALIESAYRGDESRRGWTTEADLVAGPRTDHDEVARAVAGSQSCLLVAERDATLVGCCRLAVVGPAVAELGMFAVRPGLQGAGLGRRMMAEAEAEVGRRWGAATMRLLVISQRAELIAWYRRLGYRPTGQSALFADVAGHEPLVPGLRFAVLEKQIAPEVDRR